MKIITILLNIILFGFAIYLWIVDAPQVGGVELFAFLMVLITPLLNLYIICSTKGGDWLSLFLKRKALEEKKKIEKLQG